MRADTGGYAKGAPARKGMAIALMLIALAVLLFVFNLSRMLQPVDWPDLLFSSDTTDISTLLARESLLPRFVVGLLSGAGLALAGTIFQHVLRNPLAEPATLGVSAGAQLALVIVTLWYPSAVDVFGAQGVAFLGGLSAILLVAAVGWSHVISPIRMIVAGVFISIYAGALAGVLVLFHQHYLIGVFIWSSGSLVQNGWECAYELSLGLLFGAAFAVVLLRPLALLALGDEGARGLGVKVSGARLAALALATGLSASIVSAVGMIAFVGLAAPVIARSAGSRMLSTQLMTAPFIGAGLLCMTDQLVQIVPFSREIPTGAATAIIGAPLLLWLLPRMGAMNVPSAQRMSSTARLTQPIPLLIVGFGCLVVTVWCTLALGRTPQGWLWLKHNELAEMLPWRWPRVLASGMAGGMLAAAGVLIQRMTANPLGSPEILGLSSGAALGLIVLLFVMPAPSPLWQFLATTAGAALAFVAILTLGARNGFATDKLLLAGISFGMLLSALSSVLMASGDPRMATLLGWMAGSTYSMTEDRSLALAAIACLLLAFLPLTMRPLEILPLGEDVSRSLGMRLRQMRSGLLLIAAGLTAAATLIVGPLTFVGLLAPHITRLAGFQRPVAHLMASVFAGTAIMLGADWLGRNVIFPYQVPAGLFASFLAGPFFLLLLRRQ